MSWRTNPIVLCSRRIGRAIGVNRLVERALYRDEYEEKFQNQMLGAIETGDCIWDIGANVGLYTREFSNRVGDEGKVVAFEPSPINFRKLMDNTKALVKVIHRQCALGDSDSMVRFQQGNDAFGARSRVLSSSEIQGTSVQVEICKADTLIDRGDIPIPNIVKIDTEGYELDVLRGMDCLLDKPELRVVCIEVHFGILEQRGIGNAPSLLEAMLVSKKFKISWPDPSHIIARKDI